MNKAVIVDAARTPFTRAFDPTDTKGRRGLMADVSPLDMLITVSNTMIDRTGVNPSMLDHVLVGCVVQEGGQSLNIGRHMQLSSLSKIPDSVPGTTMNQFCASSMKTIHTAAGSIMAGQEDAVLCMGVESMSSSPMGGWGVSLHDSVYNGNVPNFLDMGSTAENLATKYKISRNQQEEFARLSHEKTVAALDRGAYEGEIIPVLTPSGDNIDRDGCVKREWDADKIQSLRPAFLAGGSVTAATSSPTNDGASGVLVCSDAFAKAHDLPVMAEIVSYASTGCAPEIMGIGPVESSHKALGRGGLSLEDVDGWELNEAFAAQVMAVQKDLNIPDALLNPDGGALAIGHPLGASGGRIVGHLARRIQREECRIGVASMCIGGGQGSAIVLKHYEP